MNLIVVEEWGRGQGADWNGKSNKSFVRSTFLKNICKIGLTKILKIGGIHIVLQSHFEGFCFLPVAIQFVPPASPPTKAYF